MPGENQLDEFDIKDMPFLKMTDPRYVLYMQYLDR
jgi:hypothetical protein